MNKAFQKKILFVVIFVILGLVSTQIPLSLIIGGEGRAFTAFEFLAPTSGMFLNSFPGAISVFFVRLSNALFAGKLDIPTIIGFFTMPLAAVYFGLTKKNRLEKLILIIPILAIFLFILHPEGQKAWFFSLFWLIPIFAFFKKDRLIFNALGSTFTAHCIGSVAFLYAFNLSAPIWLGLIPIVLVERFSFAFGIWASYLLLNSALEKLLTKVKILTFFQPLVNPKYTLSKNFFRFHA